MAVIPVCVRCNVVPCVCVCDPSVCVCCYLDPCVCVCPSLYTLCSSFFDFRCVFYCLQFPYLLPVWDKCAFWLVLRVCLFPVLLKSQDPTELLLIQYIAFVMGKVSGLSRRYWQHSVPGIWSCVVFTYCCQDLQCFLCVFVFILIRTITRYLVSVVMPMMLILKRLTVNWR